MTLSQSGEQSNSLETDQSLGVVGLLKHGITTDLKTWADEINTVVKHLSQNEQRRMLSSLEPNVAQYICIGVVVVAFFSRGLLLLLLLLGGFKSVQHACVHLAQKSGSRA